MLATRTRASSLAAVVATSALLLAACADGEDGGSSSAGTPSSQSVPVYEFQPEGSVQSRSLTIAIPSDLREVIAAEYEDEELLMDSVAITGLDLDSAEYCAVELKPKYTKGAVSAITAKDADDPQDSAEKYGDEFKIALSLDLSETGYSTDELDKADPVTGAYVSKDLQSITVVQDCATEQWDSDNAGTFSFRTYDDGGQSHVAEVEFTVMADGKVAAIGEVAEYERDSNGEWIKN